MIKNSKLRKNENYMIFRLASFLVLLTVSALAILQLSAVFSDNMLLQRDQRRS